MLRMKNIRAAEVDLARNQIFATVNVGVPVNGTSGTGAGKCGKGSTCVDKATGIQYTNTGTLLSPTWVTVGSQT